MSAIDQVIELLGDLKELCPSGFAIALHIDFTTPKYVIQTYDDDWMEYYSSKGLHMKDPAVLWGMENNGVVGLAEMEAIDAFGVFKDAARFGLNHWVVVATSDHGSKSIAAFSRDEQPFSDADRDRVADLFRQLHSVTLSATDADPTFGDLMNRLSLNLTHRT